MNTAPPPVTTTPDETVTPATIVGELWSATPGFRYYWPVPAAPLADSAFGHWLQQPVLLPRVKASGADCYDLGPFVLNNLSLALYRHRTDLRTAFPDPFGIDWYRFACWFVAWAQSHGLPAAFYESVSHAVDNVRHKPLLRLRHWLWRHYANIIFTIYHRSPGAHRLYAAINPLLERTLLGRFFEAIVARLFAENNVLPLAVNWRQHAPPVQSFGVNVIGFLNDVSGLGQAGNDIAAALANAGVPVARNTIGGVPARMQRETENHDSGDNPFPFNLFYLGALNQYALRLYGGHRLQHRFNIGFLWWERDRLPPLLLENLRVFDEVWVGSGFLKSVLQPLLSAPVYQLPIAIPRPAPNTCTRAEFGLPPDRHLFLFAFDPYSGFARKNPQAVIAAYLRAFGPHDAHTALVIKTKNLAQFPHEARELRSAIRAMGGTLIDRTLSRPDLDALYTCCDTYVSLHRVEGLGATLAEAMRHNLPVIATGYSGNMDFMTPENSYPVSYTLADAAPHHHDCTAGAQWATPDIEHAASFMQHVVQRPDEARARAARAAARIEAHYSSERFAAAAITRLRAIAAARFDITVDVALDGHNGLHQQSAHGS